MIKQAFINRLNAGMVNDIRSDIDGVCRLVKNFDATTYPARLVPSRSSESGQDTTTRHIKTFAYASGKLWGLGDDNGGGSSFHVTVYYKTDFTDGSWTTTANNVGSIGLSTVPSNLFVYYHGFLYGFQATQSIWKYDTTGSAGFTDADLSLGSTATVVNQGIVHSKDDILYVPWDNKIAANKNGSWTAAALTLPNTYQITSICEYGNYLAIGCRNLNGAYQPSRVFLWDRDSSVTTLAESIDWGIGDLRQLEEYEGTLLGFTFLTDVTQNGAPEEKLIIRRYSGAQGALQVMQLTGSDPGGNATGIYGFHQKINNKIYFLAAIFYDGVYQNGLWSFGHNLQTEPLALVFERSPNNDTAVADLNNFFLVGNYTFIAYDGAGAISKTDNASSYTATAIYESTINPSMDVKDKILNKQLLSIGVSYDPLPTAGQVVLKYKIDSNATWGGTTVFTDTDGTVVTEATYDVSGNKFTAGREYQFRIESTGGAQITGVKYRYEILESLI